jgi:hypothetical protein
MKNLNGEKYKILLTENKKIGIFGSNTPCSWTER